MQALSTFALRKSGFNSWAGLLSFGKIFQFMKVLTRGFLSQQGPKCIQSIDQAACAYCCRLSAQPERAHVSGHHDPGSTGGSQHWLQAQAALLPSPLCRLRTTTYCVRGSEECGVLGKVSNHHAVPSLGSLQCRGRAWPRLGLRGSTPTAPQQPCRIWLLQAFGGRGFWVGSPTCVCRTPRPCLSTQQLPFALGLAPQWGTLCCSDYWAESSGPGR